MEPEMNRWKRPRVWVRRALVLGLSVVTALGVALVRPDAANAEVLVADGFEGAPAGRWTIQSSGEVAVGFSEGSLARSGTAYASMDFFGDNANVRLRREFTMASRPNTTCFPGVYMRSLDDSRQLRLTVFMRDGVRLVLSAAVVTVSSTNWELYSWSGFAWRGEPLVVGFETLDATAGTGLILLDDFGVNCVGQIG
jgi:hypothetical protein